MHIITTLLILAVYIYLGQKKPAIAIVTSFFVTGVILSIGVMEEDALTVFIAFLILLATFITVSLSRPDYGQWPQILAKWILWIFLFLLFAITMGIVFGPLGGFFFIFSILFVTSIIVYSITSRHTTAMHVISTIGSIMRQNLPLTMALESAAGGRTDKRSIILQRIQKWLVQGYSLSEAIKKGYPKCPGYAVAMITAAERIDQLPSAISAIESDMIVKSDESRRIKPIHPLYPIILIFFTFLILLLYIKFVLPQFKTVLEEMIAGKLPFATQILMEIVNFLTHEHGWIIWVAFGLIFFAIPVSIHVKFRPRRPDKPYLLSRIGDFIKWHLPIFHWFDRNYSLVQVTELLKLSLNSGYTVNDAIKNTLCLDVNNCFKKRLKKWQEKVERGNDIATAVRESKLGSTLAWAFDEKINQGNTLSILETLESCYRSNYSYRVNLARFILWPCLTLFMAMIVGFVVYAIFSPSIFVIKHLTEMINP